MLGTQKVWTDARQTPNVEKLTVLYLQCLYTTIYKEGSGSLENKERRQVGGTQMMLSNVTSLLTVCIMEQSEEMDPVKRGRCRRRVWQASVWKKADTAEEVHKESRALLRDVEGPMEHRCQG